MSTVDTIKDLTAKLKLGYEELSIETCIKLAIEIQRNQILENAFGVSRDASLPSALEAMAIVLGFKTDSNDSIVSAIHYLAESK